MKTVWEQRAKRTMNIPYISMSNPQASEALWEDGYFRVTCKRALMCTVTKAPATNGETQAVNSKHVGVLGNDRERHPRQTDTTRLLDFWCGRETARERDGLWTND